MRAAVAVLIAASGLSALAGCSLGGGSTHSHAAGASTPGRTAGEPSIGVAATALPGAPAGPATLLLHHPGRHLQASLASATAIHRQRPAGPCRLRGSGVFTRPDPRCTPGAIDPSVTQANIRSTICRPGYARRVRPPAWVTRVEKRRSMRAYGLRHMPQDYEYDHLVALELGGARNAPRNLWPEPGPSPNRKDILEDRLNALVCTRQISLATAREAIAVDWVEAYRQLIR